MPKKQNSEEKKKHNNIVCDKECCQISENPFWIAKNVDISGLEIYGGNFSF
jgi:hypothetical protein